MRFNQSVFRLKVETLFASYCVASKSLYLNEIAGLRYIYAKYTIYQNLLIESTGIRGN